MKQPEYLWKGVGKGSITLHHAYLLLGQRDAVLSDLMEFLKHAMNFETQRNPDFYYGAFDTLTIDESRYIKEVQQRVPVGERKIIVLAFNAATTQAQNALLKVLEEPAAQVHFFLIAPRGDFLLPTLLSRLNVIDGRGEMHDAAKTLALEFLASTRQKRLIKAKEISEKISDGELDRDYVIDFLSSLEELMWKQREKSGTAVFEDIALARKYINDKSSSVKMLLEHLALVFPLTPK